MSRSGTRRPVRQRGAVVPYPQSAELGDEVAHRLVELEPALLVERQQGDARDGFGHRVDAEDGVRRHRRPTR